MRSAGYEPVIARLNEPFQGLRKASQPTHLLFDVMQLLGKHVTQRRRSEFYTEADVERTDGSGRAVKKQFNALHTTLIK